MIIFIKQPGADLVSQHRASIHNQNIKGSSKIYFAFHKIMIEITAHLYVNILNSKYLFRCLDIDKNALIKSGACDTFLHLFEIEISILRRYINFFGYGSHIYVSNV